MVTLKYDLVLLSKYAINSVILHIYVAKKPDNQDLKSLVVKKWIKLLLANEAKKAWSNSKI
jgi:hypothetical protein